jgi:predicted permease
MDVAANEDEDRILHDFLEWRQSLRSVTDIGAWRNSNRNLIVSPGGDVRPVLVAEMSVSGFSVSDGEPLMGRVFVDADEQPSAPPVVVIGYDVWRTRFDGDPDVLGRTVQLGDEHPTVVGVMREGYEFPVSHDVWLPLKTAGLDRQPRSGPSIVVFGLLAPGETLQTAQAELTTAGRRIAAQFPDTHQHLEPFVRPYAMMASPAGEPSGQMILYSVYFFTGLLLILICGNVGLLLFARAASREADLVVRTALGASRGRIVGQMFAEALVLGSIAAIAGVAAADVTLRNWGIVFLETNLGELPFWFDLSLSPQAFLVAIVLTVACAAVAGIMPALKITRGMGDRLKQTTAGAGGLQFGGVWTVVIVAQVAATVMFPAIVYLEQSLLSGVREFDAGFPTEQYLAVKIERDDPVEADPNADAALFERNARLMVALDELRQRVTAQPGVAGVTFSEDIPTTNRPNKAIDMGYDVDAASAEGGANTQALFRSATIAPVDPSYFGVLEPQILAGRTFTAADALPGARVAIVDQGFVDQVLQGRNAVGQQVRFRYGGPAAHPWSPVNGNDPEVRPGDWYEVIGVVPELCVGSHLQY